MRRVVAEVEEEGLVLLRAHVRVQHPDGLLGQGDGGVSGLREVIRAPVLVTGDPVCPEWRPPGHVPHELRVALQVPHVGPRVRLKPPPCTVHIGNV